MGTHYIETDQTSETLFDQTPLIRSGCVYKLLGYHSVNYRKMIPEESECNNQNKSDKHYNLDVSTLNRPYFVLDCDLTEPAETLKVDISAPSGSRMLYNILLVLTQGI